MLRMQRVHDHLLLEEEFVENQERLRKAKAASVVTPSSAGGDSDALDRNADERGRVDDMRGSPMGVGNLEELIDDDHAIVSSATGPEYYVSIMSFVDKDLLEPGASILLHNKSVSVVGVLTDDTDPAVNVMKLDKAPTETYGDIGGLETQIQEVREAVELPLMTLSCTRRWASSPRKVSFSTVRRVPARHYLPKPSQTKHQPHSSALLVPS
jgi:26S proteasome regulatory subunit T2